MLCSVLIPARNEIFLQRTIQDVLEHARGATEVIAVTDGYQPDPPLLAHPRVKVIHNETSIGQRQATNQAARESRAQFIMKLDAHCAVDEGFDVKLAADCERDWTVLPVMRHLEAFQWVCSCGRLFPQGPEPQCHDVKMDIVWRVREGRAKRTEFMFIDPELRARYFDGKAKRQYRWKDHYARHATGDICDVMVGMGPGWFMDRDRYWYLGGMDEAHGGWGQMGVEVALKTWLSGGRQVVNRKTWFAHLFRTQPGFSWPYQITDAEVDRARAYSRDLWLNDKWPLAKRPLRWVLDHFAPVPGWNGAAVTKPAPQPEAGSEATPSDFRMSYYHSFRKRPVESAFPWSFPTWRGLPVIKYPEDLFFYQQILWNHRPDVLIETGTERGGSAHFFADVMDLIGHGQVITIDRVDHHIPDHPRIVKIIGRSTACDTLAKVRELVQGKSVMVSLDSLHVRRHVKRELVYYGPMVTQGQYLVVEDCFPREIGAAEAVDWYLARPRPFTRVESNYLMTLNAWLKRQ